VSSWAIRSALALLSKNTMSIRIHRLTCTVRVRTGLQKHEVHNAGRAPSRPTLQLAHLPAPDAGSDHGVEEMAGLLKGAKDAKPVDQIVQEAVAHVDTQAVADRVYNLMREEALHSRTRGFGGRRSA
jgi:hypothetical protein